MKKIEFAAAIVVAALTGCAAQPALLKETASGKPEATLPNVTMDEVRNEIALGCNRMGSQVISDQFSVTCTKETEGNRAFLAQALLGNGYSQTPHENIRFTMSPTTGGVFVTVDGWMEMTMGFGEKKRVPYNNNNFRNAMQSGLDQLSERLSKADAPPGHETGTPQQKPAEPAMKWRPPNNL